MVTLHKRFYIIACVLCALVFAIAFGAMRNQLVKGSTAIAEAREEKELLNLELRERRDTLQYRKSDEYVMRVARDELNMILPGEYRYTDQ